METFTDTLPILCNGFKSVIDILMQIAAWSTTRYSQWLSDHVSQKERLALIRSVYIHTAISAVIIMIVFKYLSTVPSTGQCG